MTGPGGEGASPGGGAATGEGPGKSSPSPRTEPRPGSPVYAIADVEALAAAGAPEGEVPRAAAAMAAGGAGWIQLRAKRLPDRQLLDLARACRRALEGIGAALWIDDRPDVAALVGAAGVHVGQTDLPPADVRRILGASCWIGSSTHDRMQLLAADRDPTVDVIAVGPVFPTRSKEAPDAVVGLELVEWARSATDKPLVAIGGIDRSNIGAVVAAGADAAAVLSAVCTRDPEASVRRLVAAVESSG